MVYLAVIGVGAGIGYARFWSSPGVWCGDPSIALLKGAVMYGLPLAVLLKLFSGT
jgi:hypothetical protein